MKVKYSSNNSGGGWWLDDDDWRNLEAAGWSVKWVKDDDIGVSGDPPRFIGALARGASREGLSLQDAVAEWERVTGESSTDAGCPCCGPPHSFTLSDDDGKIVGFH